MAMEIMGIILAALLSQNYILVKFYGICPFMGVSKKIDTALGMGMAVTFVMALASAACYAVNLLLVALNVQYMQTVAFILVIASIVQVVEMFLKKMVPALYKALGVFLPLITTNCAVLGDEIEVVGLALVAMNLALLIDERVGQLLDIPKVIFVARLAPNLEHGRAAHPLRIAEEGSFAVIEHPGFGESGALRGGKAAGHLAIGQDFGLE